MNLEPLFDRVIVKPDTKKDKTDGGLFLPDSLKTSPISATIVKIGPGGLVDGDDIKMVVNVGEKVIYLKYAGIEFSIGDDTFIILRQSDILAKITSDK